MPTLTKTGAVFVLDIGDAGGGGEADADHRFDPHRIAAVGAALDEVAASTGPAALVTTASGRFYSNGLEPERFADADAIAYLADFERLLARVLSFEVPSVAALQGHTFAGGLLFALAHDDRVMRSDRGYACLPEVNIGFPFPPAMSLLAQGRLAPATAHQAMATGRRYDGPAALAAGIVDELASAEDLLDVAIERATALSVLKGPAYATIKQNLYRAALSELGAVSDLAAQE